MQADGVGATVTIVGCVAFFVAAFFGLPRVYVTPDAAARRAMLTRHLIVWRTAQAFFAVGCVTAGVGVTTYGVRGTGGSAAAAAVGGGVLTIGALSWCVDLWRRARDHEAFADGRLPGWPYVGYFWLTVAGLAVTGAAAVAGPAVDWTGWLLIGAAVAFVASYLRFHDLPPFLFYVPLTVVAVCLS